MDLAEKLFQQSRGRHQTESNTGELANTEPSESADDIYARLGVLIDRIMEMAPPSLKGGMQFTMLMEFARGIKKDMRLMPEDQLKGFMEALYLNLEWVVNGSMDDIADAG